MPTLLNPNASAEARSADNILQRIREMGCTSALIRNSTKLVTMCKASGLEVIYRAAGDDQAGNPLAQSAAEFVLSRYRAAPAADYVHLTNEIGFPAGMVEWNEIAALTAESVGKRVVAINPGTHAPVADWRRVESHLKWLTERGHKVGAHLYLDGEHDDGGWAQLDYLKSIGAAVFITEWGLIETITRDDVGWRKVLGADPSRYAVWHDARAAKLASYGYPAHLFSIDHWRDDDFGKANGFGTEDKPEFTKHCAVINAKYPIQENTPVPDIPAPDGIRAACNAPAGVWLRKTPSTSGATIRAIKYAEEVTVWAQPAVKSGIYTFIPVLTRQGEQGYAAQMVDINGVWSDTFIKALLPTGFTLKAPFRKYRVTGRFNDYRDYSKIAPTKKQAHEGWDCVDANAESIKTDPVVHVGAPGTVSKVDYDPKGYGNYIEVNHGNGFTSVYGHLAEIYVRSGQKLDDWQIIGLMGWSGNVYPAGAAGAHLHLTVSNPSIGLSGYVYPSVIDPETVLVAA